MISHMPNTNRIACSKQYLHLKICPWSFQCHSLNEWRFSKLWLPISESNVVLMAESRYTSSSLWEDYTFCITFWGCLWTLWDFYLNIFKYSVLLPSCKSRHDTRRPTYAGTRLWRPEWSERNVNLPYRISPTSFKTLALQHVAIPLERLSKKTCKTGSARIRKLQVIACSWPK